MRSSCLWFYMFGVERFSFLPDLQRDGGDLARQRQPGHFRSYALGQQSGVKLTEYSLAKASHRGVTLEQAFQFVAPASCEVLPRPKPLPRFEASLLFPTTSPR